MATYKTFTIGGVLGNREYENDEATFNKVVADWVISGGEIGVWKFTKSENRKRTGVTVVGFYSKFSDGGIDVCWTISSEWFTEGCCNCGCGASCADCQCCCKMCGTCDECACCCDCA